VNEGRGGGGGGGAGGLGLGFGAFRTSGDGVWSGR